MGPECPQSPPASQSNRGKTNAARTDSTAQGYNPAACHGRICCWRNHCCDNCPYLHALTGRLQAWCLTSLQAEAASRLGSIQLSGRNGKIVGNCRVAYCNQRLAEDRRRHRSVWYESQKEHWVGWLYHCNSPGAYGRKITSGRDARFVYNHVVCPGLLAYLAEAVSPKPWFAGQARSRCRWHCNAASRRYQAHRPMATDPGRAPRERVCAFGGLTFVRGAAA